MDVDVFLDDSYNVNTIINVRLKPNGKPEKVLKVNDFDLERNLNYKKAYEIDNSRKINLNTALLNKNDIWHKRHVFIQLYWFLDYHHSSEEIDTLNLVDGVCNAKVNNVFYSDGERRYSLFTSPVYNINRVINAFLKDKDNIELVGTKKRWMNLRQWIREACFFLLCFLMFFKLFLIKIKPVKKNNRLLAISRGYAHVSYFTNVMNEEEIVEEHYRWENLVKNLISMRFWQSLFRVVKITRKNIRFDNLNIEPHSKYSKSELLARFIQSLPMTLLYVNHIQVRKGQHVVSAELLTAHSSILYFFVKQDCNRLSIVQTVSLFKMNNFHFNYCDNFLFEDYSLYKWFSQKHDDPRNYRYEGNGYSVQNRIGRGLQKILYISQPSLKSEDVDFKIVSKVSKICAAKLQVRLHPRDTNDRYKTLGVYQGRSDLKIEDCDLVITRTSSIAVQSIYCDIPVVFCLFDDWSRNNSHYYIPRRYFGNAMDLNMLEDIILNYQTLTSAFAEYRRSFFRQNTMKDKESLRNFLNGYK